MARDLHNEWRGGWLLAHAWRVVPNADLQDQYEASGDVFERRAFVIRMMETELTDLLRSRDFIAIGVELGARPNAQLAVVPAHFFAERSHCDFDESKVSAYGTTFEQVRVIGLPPSPRAARMTGSVPQAEEAQTRSDATASSASCKPAPTRMGRPSIIPILREVIAAIGQSTLAPERPSMRIKLVTERAMEMHADRFSRKSPPSKNTVREALRQEGFVTSRAQKVS